MQLIQSFTEILVVVDAANSLHVLDVENGDLLVQIPAPDSIKKYSAMVHPLTYKNKVSGNIFFRFRELIYILYQFVKSRTLFSINNCS